MDDLSLKWPKDHIIEVSRDWPQEHERTFSRNWFGSHDYAWSLTWPKEGHTVDYSGVWPNDHITNVTLGYPKNHDSTWSRNWPGGHAIESSNTWIQEGHDVWNSVFWKWPRDHSYGASQEWPNKEFPEDHSLGASFAYRPFGDSEDNGQDGTNGGCLITTAAYGTELASEVQALREIRDHMLMNTNSGASFMNGFNLFYYSFSPYVADYERQNPAFKELVKFTIMPMIYSLSIMGVADGGSEFEVLALGSLVISLNLGLYFGLPAFFILAFRKHIR